MIRYAHPHAHHRPIARKDQSRAIPGSAPRPDGFHALTTVYQTLEMHDLVTVTAKPSGTTTLRITSNDPRVPTAENNLAERNTAWKMVSLALDALETPQTSRSISTNDFRSRAASAQGPATPWPRWSAWTLSWAPNPQPVHPETRASRPSRLRCPAVSHRRNGSRRRSRAGSLSAQRYRANLVRGRRA